MLLLSRNRHQNIVIGDRIVVSVLGIRRGRVRLGISAPKELPVHRQEVFDVMDRPGAGRQASSGGIGCDVTSPAAEAQQTVGAIDAKRPPWVARVYRLADLSADFASARPTFSQHVL